MLSSSGFCGGKYPPPSAWYHASAFLIILSGPLAQWAERGADTAKAVSSILTGTTILVSPFFCSCISLLQSARVTDLLITGQLVLAGAPLNNFWVFIQFPISQIKARRQTVSLWVSSFGSFVRFWYFASDVLRNLCFSHCKRSLNCFVSLNLSFLSNFRFYVVADMWDFS